MPAQDREWRRKTFNEEWEELKLLDEKAILLRIFRELWDIRQENLSISRTLESQNV